MTDHTNTPDLDAIRARLKAYNEALKVLNHNNTPETREDYHVAKAFLDISAPADIRDLLYQHDADAEAARLREIDCALLETRVAGLEAALQEIANVYPGKQDDFDAECALLRAHGIARDALDGD